LIDAVAVLTAVAVFAPTKASAWHDPGHMTVALIAYRNLGEADQGAIREILKQHPHYNLHLSRGAPAHANLDEWVVMQAATWPDWVRSERPGVPDTVATFHHAFWHFAKQPVRMLDGSNADMKNMIEANIAKEQGEVLDLLPKLIAAVKDPVAAKAKAFVTNPNTVVLSDNAARAVALCWVLHLIGDIHQPLHAVSRYSKELPSGDRGGNEFYVRFTQPGLTHERIEDLHTFWDSLIFWSMATSSNPNPYMSADMTARDLGKRITPTAAELGEKDCQAWVKESQALAEKFSYMDGSGPVPGAFKIDHFHKPTASDILTALSDDYLKTAKSIAEKRVMLGGVRLADVLKTSLAMS
jgi:hypothetical protein